MLFFSFYFIYILKLYSPKPHRNKFHFQFNPPIVSNNKNIYKTTPKRRNQREKNNKLLHNKNRKFAFKFNIHLSLC